MTTESQITADIEALRKSVPDTKDLYREVCTILFFRYGVTPTANKLYQYVRKGSMSAPAEALGKFWEDLREKSRVRIEHPDLPDELKTAAGEMVAALWTQSQAAAHEGLAAYRVEAQNAVLEAQTTKANSENDRAAALKELEQARHSAQMAFDRSLQLERDLASERASKDSLSTQLAAAGLQNASLEAALSEARRDFAAELEKLRQALQKSEERYDAKEKHALLEIDRERTSTVKLQKELVQLRQTHLEATDRLRNEITKIQNELANARQGTGVAEGMLREMRNLNQQQTEQLQSLQTLVAERDTRNVLLQRDLEMQRLLAKQPAKTVSIKPRRRRKS
ncbi:hypothetical protein SKTS_21860 [Sulfurimicrobium lacus]|uniref:KfrA N-terminal DNA-binding domain-containing protein n=1 Tax=Sulfurimicrobium lacus TaxID=2715678 RepID=A0A6F8VD85_9PROT|nr:DNA-binding protein [Sulfurimicrobium lacus]BCB27300.1 hypothetical protein SKTS_21860 [Sulfurimicrobium lacus]